MTLDQSAQGAETAPDHDEIVQFIETGYINAFHEADYSKMRRFFHRIPGTSSRPGMARCTKARLTTTRCAAGQDRIRTGAHHPFGDAGRRCGVRGA